MSFAGDARPRPPGFTEGQLLSFRGGRVPQFSGFAVALMSWFGWGTSEPATETPKAVEGNGEQMTLADFIPDQSTASNATATVACTLAIVALLKYFSILLWNCHKNPNRN